VSQDSSRQGPETTKAREHLANERTLLAWIRTAIAMMGLGFVVARFGLFLHQLALEKVSTGNAPPELSAGVGIAFVAAGVVACLLSLRRFFRARRQIEVGQFEPEVLAEMVVATVTIVGGVALIVYLAITG
jgi:putative membrane protein